MSSVGKVFLVGAGPGDPGLITVKGMECLRQADIILYDRLVDPRLLRHARSDAECVYVGKAVGNVAMTQEEINAFLMEQARAGKCVVRLKGGDPFVFGRGGEEAEALAAAGIPFAVVPGVTAAIGVPAYAGIPVTQRGVTSSLAIVTGHEDPTKPDSQIAWDKLATATGTLVFLMGVENLPQIVAELVRHGRSPQTPIALIRWGTWSQQETVQGTLEDIVERLQGQEFGPPAVIVVGEVVSLRERLRWYDNRPLSGKRVLVTRSRDQASALSALLAEAGAQPIEVPAIQIQEPEDYHELDSALARLSEFDWIVFTSVNGVAALFRRLRAMGQDSRALAGVRLCAVGSATARALEEQGLRADLVPSEFLTQAVGHGLIERGIRGARILLPRTDIAGEELAQRLTEAGAIVEQVMAYRTVAAEEIPAEALELLRQGHIDVVTFASSSTVRNLVALLREERDLLDRFDEAHRKRPAIACIGPVTARTARDLGLHVEIEAQEHTIPGLVRAIVDYWEGATSLETGDEKR